MAWMMAWMIEKQMTNPFTRLTAVLAVAGLVLMLAIPAAAASSHDEADAEQAALDLACADAREEILSVERNQLVAECVNEKFPRDDRTGCERFYADHGARAGGRAPLYMDLPECVTAHEFRQNRSP